jgi:hypothetical protein
MAAQTARDEILDRIQEIALLLSEEQLIAVFAVQMIDAGYLSPRSRPVFSYWRSAHDWLRSYVDNQNIEDAQLEAIASDMQCKLDYPDS